MRRAAMVLRVAVTLAAALAASPAVAGWRSLGPEGAQVVGLAFSASEPGVVWAATPDGLYRSLDGGASWSAAGLQGRTVRAVAVHPRDGRGVWAAVTESEIVSSVWRSRDGGNSFERHELGVWTDRMWELALDVEDASTAYLATDRGLLITRDGGESWAGAAGTLGSEMTRLVLARPGAVFAATVGFELLHRSTDRGVTWSAGSPGPEWGWFLDADVAGRTLWLAREEGLLTSMDGGESWAPAPGSLPPYRTVAGGLAVSPDARSVLVGSSGAGPLASDDGGSTWTSLACPPPRCACPNDPFHPYFDPTSSGAVLAVVPGGLARSLDRGATWTAANRGLGGPTVEAILASPDGTLWVAAHDQGIFRSNDGGTFWTFAGGDLPYGMWREEAPAFHVVSLTEIEGSIVAGTTDGAYVTRDAGSSWARLDGIYGTVGALLQDPARPSTLVATSVGVGMIPGGLYVSQDGGATWQEKLGGVSAGGLAADTRTGALVASVLINATYGWPEFRGIVRSTDHGATWTHAAAMSDLAALVADRRAPGRIWAANGRVLRSDDGGQSWTEVASPSPCEPPWRTCGPFGLLVDEARNRLLSVAGDRIYESLDDGGTWSPLMPEVPVLPAVTAYWPSLHVTSVPTLALDASGRLLAGTIGRGLFVLEPDVRVPRRLLSR